MSFPGLSFSSEFRELCPFLHDCPVAFGNDRADIQHVVALEIQNVFHCSSGNAMRLSVPDGQVGTSSELPVGCAPVPREGEVNTWDEIHRNLQGRLFCSISRDTFCSWLRHCSCALIFPHPQQQERSNTELLLGEVSSQPCKSPFWTTLAPPAAL